MATRERHRSGRIGWLRAAVLGANDGIVSTASLGVGVAAASANRQQVLLAGVAGVVAGAFSMAAGEYVSVSSQADTERADLNLERRELATQPEFEQEELTAVGKSIDATDNLFFVIQKLSQRRSPQRIRIRILICHGIDDTPDLALDKADARSGFIGAKSKQRIAVKGER